MAAGASLVLIWRVSRKRLNIIAALAGAGLASSAAVADTYGDATVDRVTSIYDGDTFRVDVDVWPAVIGERMPIRLRGADTPELRGDCRHEIQKARAAKRFTVTRLRGAETIELRRLERGKYFRLVATVLVDGRNLADLLIGAGLARTYDGKEPRRDWC